MCIYFPSRMEPIQDSVANFIASLHSPLHPGASSPHQPAATQPHRPSKRRLSSPPTSPSPYHAPPSPLSAPPPSPTVAGRIPPPSPLRQAPKPSKKRRAAIKPRSPSRAMPAANHTSATSTPLPAASAPSPFYLQQMPPSLFLHPGASITIDFKITHVSHVSLYFRSEQRTQQFYDRFILSGHMEGV